MIDDGLEPIQMQMSGGHLLVPGSTGTTHFSLSIMESECKSSPVARTSKADTQTGYLLLFIWHLLF